MLFDPSLFLTALTAILLGLAGAAGVVAGIAKICLGYSWSYHPSRIYSKHNRK